MSQNQKLERSLIPLFSPVISVSTFVNMEAILVLMELWIVIINENNQVPYDGASSRSPWKLKFGSVYI